MADATVGQWNRDPAYLQKRLKQAHRWKRDLLADLEQAQDLINWSRRVLDQAEHGKQAAERLSHAWRK